ncbi:unnamed protein product [Linum tenue]|uniref:Uncharacterized protein n=1 Tax=Linum tenue TaxID=586396 RepID=A0AAV0Q2L5_9ROSI|nr:unnamed protein product [Linum tenue]
MSPATRDILPHLFSRCPHRVLATKCLHRPRAASLDS